MITLYPARVEDLAINKNIIYICFLHVLVWSLAYIRTGYKNTKKKKSRKTEKNNNKKEEKSKFAYLLFLTLFNALQANICTCSLTCEDGR